MPKCARGCGRDVASDGQTCSFCTFGPRVSAAPGRQQPRAAAEPAWTPPALRAVGMQPRPAVAAATFTMPALQHTPAVVKTPPAPLVAPGTLPAGANLVVKCRRQGTQGYTDINPAQMLYVLHNSTVDFKLEARNAAANLLALVVFDTANWGGTAAAQSFGKSKSVHFNRVSSANNAGGAYTVSVAFGGVTVSINCIVYSLTTTSTPADDFVGRSQTDLGVDERVTLGFTTLPVGVSAPQAGGLQWKTVGVSSRNTVGLVHGIAGAAAPVAQDGIAVYVAPCRTHAVTEPDVATKTVTLKLEVVSGPSIGLGREVTFTIYKPAAHMRVGAGNHRHVNGQPSAGFWGVIFFTPRNVSFQGLLFREGVGNMELWPRPPDPNPFPLGWEGMPHAATGGPGIAIGPGHATNGCQLPGVQDDVYSGAITYTPPRGGGSPSTVVAWQRWPIEWQYTYSDLVTGAAQTDWITMQRAYHKATLYESGRMVMFKGHIGCASGDCMRDGDISKALNDPTVP